MDGVLWDLTWRVLLTYAAVALALLAVWIVSKTARAQ